MNGVAGGMKVMEGFGGVADVGGGCWWRRSGFLTLSRLNCSSRIVGFFSLSLDCWVLVELLGSMFFSESAAAQSCWYVFAIFFF